MGVRWANVVSSEGNDAVGCVYCTHWLCRGTSTLLVFVVAFGGGESLYSNPLTPLAPNVQRAPQRTLFRT